MKRAVFAVSHHFKKLKTVTQTLWTVTRQILDIYAAYLLFGDYSHLSDGVFGNQIIDNVRVAVNE